MKRIHGLMPYFMMKTALKISNPVGMIRSSYFNLLAGFTSLTLQSIAMLDLFLAQPFGGRSLLQRYVAPYAAGPFV